MPGQLIMTAGPLRLKAPEDKAEAFAGMEQEALEGEMSQALSDPILPCETPYLELSLLDGDGEPAAFANYRIAVAGAAPQSGTLDANGYVRIEGLNVSADEVMLKVHITEDPDDPGAVPVYEIQLVALEAMAAESLEEEPAPDVLPYFHPAFDQRMPIDDKA